jgi:hypothetical protein
MVSRLVERDAGAIRGHAHAVHPGALREQEALHRRVPGNRVGAA